MSFSGLIPPQELELLTNLRDEYCAAHNISDKRARKEVGVQLMALFESGAITTATVRAALQKQPNFERKALGFI